MISSFFLPNRCSLPALLLLLLFTAGCGGGGGNDNQTTAEIKGILLAYPENEQGTPQPVTGVHTVEVIPYR